MKILKYKKFAGLHIVCKKCSKHIEVSAEPYKLCSHPLERQRYKAIISIEGQRKTRDLKAVEYDEAIKELLEFKENLANPMDQVQVPKKEVRYDGITDCILLFSDWMENIDVPKHEQRYRSPEHIKDTVRYLMRFRDFLIQFKVDKINIIDKHHIGRYYEHLETSVKAVSTFNHNLRALKAFYNFLTNEKEYLIPNIMKKVKLKYENPNPVSIADNDFKKLLVTISEKNSVHSYSNGVRKNMFRPYIKDAIELVAYTGMRLEEAISIKFSDIVVNESGKLNYVIGTDLKFERAHNWDKSKAPKIVLIPYSKELEDLLQRLDYRNKLGQNNYLIAPDEKISRKTLATQLSHSFTFFRRKAGISDKICIKHLRKTFLTKLHTQTGLTLSMGYQKSASVILNNYIDKVEVVKEVGKRKFGYFQDA